MKKISIHIFSLLIGLAIALIFLELFLRINPKFGYNYMRPSSLLGYEIIPDCPRVFPVSSNSYGLIGKEYKLDKDKNTFRILLLGDSIAAQDYSREFLEENLNNNFLLHSKYRFEIWNAGVPSYDVRRYYLFLKHKGLGYGSDMVIIFIFMNDFELNINIYYKTSNGVSEYYFPMTEISKIYTVNSLLMRRSYLYRFIILRLDSYLLSKKKTPKVDPPEEKGYYYLQMVKDICTKNNIPLFLVIFPYLKPLSEYKKYQNEQYQNINKVIRDLGINHLNLYECLIGKDLYSLRERKEDEIHPSNEGHRLIAKIIYDYMINLKILEK